MIGALESHILPFAGNVSHRSIAKSARACLEDVFAQAVLRKAEASTINTLSALDRPFHWYHQLPVSGRLSLVFMMFCNPWYQHHIGSLKKTWVRSMANVLVRAGVDPLSDPLFLVPSGRRTWWLTRLGGPGGRPDKIVVAALEVKFTGCVTWWLQRDGSGAIMKVVRQWQRAKEERRRAREDTRRQAENQRRAEEDRRRRAEDLRREKEDRRRAKENRKRAIEASDAMLAAAATILITSQDGEHQEQELVRGEENTSQQEPSGNEHHVDAFASDEKDEQWSKAIQESMDEAISLENSYVSRAVMCSKVDAPVSNDGVVVMRLNKLGSHAEVIAGLTSSEHLRASISRVAAAGCEVAPSWTPALLLVPLTELQLEELGVQLCAHHVVGLAADIPLVRLALQGIRGKIRPSIRAPAPVVPHGDEDEFSIEKADHIENGDDAEIIEVVVEKTFVNCPVQKDISEASAFPESAPCGTSESAQPQNPRRWKM